jgi:hypothetical protein
MDGTRVSVIPSDDAVFASHVREFATEASSPEELEEHLRVSYPEVRVVRGVTDIVDRWYVYRDGRWTRSAAPGR